MRSVSFMERISIVAVVLRDDDALDGNARNKELVGRIVSVLTYVTRCKEREDCRRLGGLGSVTNDSTRKFESSNGRGSFKQRNSVTEVFYMDLS